MTRMDSVDVTFGGSYSSLTPYEVSVPETGKVRIARTLVSYDIRSGQEGIELLAY